MIKTQTPVKTKNLSFSNLSISKLKIVCNATEMQIPVYKKIFFIKGFL